MAKDPYRYFRIEAHELLEQLQKGALGLENAPFDGELAARLLRFSHTLKGAARVVKQLEIAKLAHRLEEELGRLREAAKPAEKADVTQLLALIDQAVHLLSTLAPAAEGPKPTQEPRLVVEEAQRTVRVDLEEMDELLSGVGEASARCSAFGKDLADFERLGTLAGVLRELLAPRRAENAALSARALDRARSLSADLTTDLDRLHQRLTRNFQQVQLELGAVREIAQTLRLLPARTLFPGLERALHDAAQALGKRVTFRAEAANVRLDAHVLSILRDALLHIVRNAVAHGIEPEGERRTRGKPESGVITLTVEHRAGRVHFRCHDDGRGIDLEAARRAAISRGLVSESAARALSTADILRLLLEPGVSTSPEVTEISGRGIGLDVVRESVARLKGLVNVSSVPGGGTSVELEVPVSVASRSALLVEVSGRTLAIPLDAVESVRAVRASEISSTQGPASLVHADETLPFLALETVLGKRAESTRTRRSWSVIILRAAERRAAIGVDRILGTGTVVMRTLPDLLQADRIIAGATLDAEGAPQLVLDPESLLRAAEAERGAGPSAGVREPPTILVIDDSLTTRMLEQSILESAGYRVELAVSAEEGLEKAHGKRYGLFLVDVEMPGIDGFEFVARTRAQPELARTPAILVTSRDAPEDRLRGQEAGADAYILKGEFEQNQLLRTISALLERA